MLRIKDWDAIYEKADTRKLAKMSWIAVPVKQDGDGYTELVTHTNGGFHLGAWLALLQIAAKCDPRGTLIRDTGLPHTPATLSRMSRLPVDMLSEAIPRLIAIGWLEDTETTNPPLIHGKFSGLSGQSPESSGNHPDYITGQDSTVQILSSESESLFPGTVTVKPDVDLRKAQESWFGLLWLDFWRKDGSRKKALEIYRGKVKDEATAQLVLAGMQAQKPGMMAREVKFRPHCQTWLNQERWEDQPEAGRKRGVDMLGPGWE